MVFPDPTVTYKPFLSYTKRNVEYNTTSLTREKRILDGLGMIKLRQQNPIENNNIGFDTFEYQK